LRLQFSYSDLVVSPTVAADPCAESVVTVLVTNIGTTHSGAEVAQLYIQPSSSSSSSSSSSGVVQPKLIGFGKTPVLAPGASSPLSFIVTAEHRSVVSDYDHTQVVEPGSWELAVGGAQPGQGQTLRAKITNQGRGPLNKCVPM
jgi:beta-glucosidase